MNIYRIAMVLVLFTIHFSPTGLFSQTDHGDDLSLEQIGSILSDELIDLDLYDVEVGISTNPSIPVDMLRFKPAWEDCRELILLRRSHIQQDSLKHSTDINETFYRVWIDLDGEYVELPRRKSLGRFTLHCKGRGANRQMAKNDAVRHLRAAFRRELKSIYWYSASIDTLDGNVIRISGGAAQGISPGMLFEVLLQDSQSAEDQTDLPFGSRIGIASVTDTTEYTSRLNIKRAWHPVHKNCRLLERLDPVSAVQLSATTSSVSRQIEFAFEGRPYATLDWGFGLYYLRVIDSRSSWANGFGFSGIGGIHLLKTAHLSFTITSAFEMSVLFSRDDAKEPVSTALFSLPLTLRSEWQLSAKRDLLLGIGYRFGNESSEWLHTNSNENTSFAYWKRKQPTSKDSGVIIKAGFRYWFF